MKKFISIIICCALLATSFPQGLFAQNFNANSFEREAANLYNRRTLEEYMAPPKMQQDNTRNIALDNARLAYELRAPGIDANFSIDALTKAREKAMEEENYKEFYNLTMTLNELLFSYLEGNSNAEVKLIAASAMLEQLKDHAITPEHAQRAYDYFENTLKTANECKNLYCEFLAVGAVTLSHSKHYFIQEANLSTLLPRGEIRVPSPHEINTQRRTELLKNVATRDFGSKESNATIATGVIFALASLGSLQDVYIAAKSIVEGHGNWARKRLNSNTYDATNDTAQIAAMDALLELGSQALPVLEAFALSRHSLTSHVHANINLVYSATNAESRAKAKTNIERYYCNQTFNLSSQEDMILKQKLAYAYGSGSRPQYVVPAGSTKCLVIYPTAPDPRLVTKEWTNVVMAEVGLGILFIGVGSAIVKSARVINHLGAIRYTAAKRGMSVAKFFRTGQLKALPTLGGKAATGARIGAATSSVTAQTAMQRGAQGTTAANTKTAATSAKTATAATPPAAATTHTTSIAHKTTAARNTTQPGKEFVTKASQTQAAQDAEIITQNNLNLVMLTRQTPKHVKPLSTKKLPLHPAADSPAVTPLEDNVVQKMIFDRSKTPPANKKGVYPSGLTKQEAGKLVENLAEAYRHSPKYHINPYILANSSLSTAKKVNLMNFFEAHPQAKKWLAESINTKGGLPSIFYSKELVHTPSFGASYISREMDIALKRLMTLSNPKKPYASNYTELKNRLAPFRDYNFEFGFNYTMDKKLQKGLTDKFRNIITLVEEGGADALRAPKKFHIFWRKNAHGNNASVNLENFFSQTITTKYSQGKSPYFIVNSKYWTNLEAEARRQTQLFLKTPGSELSWFKNPIQKARLYRKTKFNPNNYMTLDEYAAISKAGNKPVAFGKKTALGSDVTMDPTEIINNSKTKGIKFCSMEKKEGIYGTGEWSNYRDVSRFDPGHTVRQTDMPIFLDGKTQVARMQLSLKYTSDNMIGMPSKIKTRKFFLDMPDQARAFRINESKLLQDAMPDIIATAKNQGGAAARWLAYNKYPPKYINGQWYIDTRAVYLEKAISPRAQPLFEWSHIKDYNMKLLDLNKAPKFKATNLETLGIYTPTN